MSTAMPEPLVPVLSIVGTGLIGGSFAAALRRLGQVGRVLGVDTDANRLALAQELGLIDESVSLAQAAQQADLIMLAVPVSATAEVLRALVPHLAPKALISDMGSTKSDVLAMATEALGARIAQFVPGHPVAGSEQAGPQAADALLFHGRKIILTPHDATPATALRYLIRIWEICGAQTVLLDAATHDRILASVSHLPHFLAAAYMVQLTNSAEADKRLALAGSGFRDFTRIAAGSPEVWRDIFLSNRAALLAELDGFEQALHDLRASLLDEAQSEQLLALLAQAAQARRFWQAGD